MTRHRLLSEMPDGTEMVDWMALERIDPSDGMKLDVLILGLAGLRCDLINAWRSERSDPVELESFLPAWLKRPERELTAEDYRRQAEALAIAMDGVVTEEPGDQPWPTSR